MNIGTKAKWTRLDSLCGLLTLLGTVLLSINLGGILIPLRADDVTGYRDFADVETTAYHQSIADLEQLSAKSGDLRAFVTDATRVFHEGMAHISPDDIEANGSDYYNMRVPVTENWILFALSYLKPDTYRDYEFCSYRRALERGTGRCGQQSLALVSYLSEHGVKTGFVALQGHAIATARVDESTWFLLDPDYGGVIPFGISQAETNPAEVLSYYWSNAARQNRIDELYAPVNEVKYGGPEARFARACPIEGLAYAAKWAVPLTLLTTFPLLLFVRKRESRLNKK